MKDELRKLLASLKLCSGAPREALDAMVAELGVDLPTDYLDMLLFSNGGEGNFGSESGSYIIFWRAEDIVISNREYEIREDYPELIVFGQNAATAAYAFDSSRSPMPVIEADFIDPDYYEKRGDDFLDFLARMASQ